MVLPKTSAPDAQRGHGSDHATHATRTVVLVVRIFWHIVWEKKHPKKWEITPFGLCYTKFNMWDAQHQIAIAGISLANSRSLREDVSGGLRNSAVWQRQGWNIKAISRRKGRLQQWRLGQDTVLSVGIAMKTHKLATSRSASHILVSLGGPLEPQGHAKRPKNPCPET